jgi:hypothetical protein
MPLFNSPVHQSFGLRRPMRGTYSADAINGGVHPSLYGGAAGLHSAFGLTGGYSGAPAHVPMLGQMHDDEDGYVSHFPSPMNRQPGGMYGSMQEGLAALQIHNASMAARARQPMPSYASQLRDGSTPFSDAGYGGRYAAANDRLTAAHAPFNLPPLFQGQAAQQQGSNFHNMAHPGYGPMNMPPMGMAPTTQGGYDQQMGEQNPGGRFFGGALPAYGTSSGGQHRPMFMGPPVEAPPQHYSLPESRFIGGNRQYTDGSNLTAISESDPQFSRMQAARAMFDARRGGLAQRQEDYQSRVAEGRYNRTMNRQTNAINKATARRDRLGIGDPTEMFFRGNPMAGLQYGMMQQQLGLQGAHEANAHQRGMMHEQNLAQSYDSRNTTARHTALGSLYGAIAQRVQAGQGTAEDVATMRKIEAELMGVGPQGSFARGSGPGGSAAQLTPQQTEQFRRDAQANPTKAERDLIAKGATRSEAQEAIREVNPSYGTADYAAPGVWPMIGRGIGWGLDTGFGLADQFFGRPPAQGGHYYAPNNQSPAAKRWRAEQDRLRRSRSYRASGSWDDQAAAIGLPPAGSTRMPSTAQAR